MNDELQLGKYEFFPYDDKREDTEDILEELKKLLPDEKSERGKEDVIEEFLKRISKKSKK